MSELTVPRAGLSAGAAPNIRLAAPDTGEAIARFGQQMLQVGTRMETDRLDREMQRIGTEMTRDLGQARLEFEQVTDPDAIDRDWPARMAAIRQSYLTGQGADGAPRVDPKNAERFGLAFDELSNRHALALAGNAVALRHSQREAGWVEYRHELETQAATTDPATAETLLAQGEAAIDARVKAGSISPEQGAKEKLDLRGSVANAAAIGEIDRDPEGFLEAAGRGEYDALGAEAVAARRVQAEGAIAARDKAAAQAADTQYRAWKSRTEGRLRDIIGVIGKGRVSADEAILSDPAVQEAAPALVAEARGAARLRDSKNALNLQTPEETRAMIAERRRQPITQPWQHDELAALEAKADRDLTEWGKDGVAYAQSLGMAVPALPEATDPAFGDGLMHRIAFGQTLADRGYTAAPAYLTLDEQAALRERIAVSADPAERTRLARTLGSTLGRADPRALAALSDDPVFTHMAGFLAGGGNDALAAEAFRGQQALKEQNVILPPASKRVGAVFGQVGGLFADLPGGDKTLAEVTAAADALYARRMGSLDPAGDMDSGQYVQAVHEVLGGTGSYDGGTGGVQDVAGALTILPMGISAAQAERAINRLGYAGESAGRAPRVKFDAALMTEQLRAASPEGRLPVIAGAPVDREDLAEAHLRAVGDDAYVLVLPRAGGETVIEDETGEEWVFSLKRLIGGRR